MSSDGKKQSLVQRLAERNLTLDKLRADWPTDTKGLFRHKLPSRLRSGNAQQAETDDQRTLRFALSCITRKEARPLPARD